MLRRRPPVSVMGRPRRTVGPPRPGPCAALASGYGTAPAHGGAPATGALRRARQWVWDGPGRGDNRGRRRAELRGGEAGPPFARPRRGASGSIVSHGRVDAQVPLFTFRFRPQTRLRTTDSVDRQTSVEVLTTSVGDRREAGPPGRPRSCRRVLRVGDGTAHHDDGAPSLAGGGAIPPQGVGATRRAASQSSQRVQPATIGPSVDCPRVGTRGPAVGHEVVTISRLHLTSGSTPRRRARAR